MRAQISVALHELMPIERSKRIAKGIMIFILPILFLVNICATPENAFWDKKDYRQWSEWECKKMLMDSPWAKGWHIGSYGYVVQLYSALPIRQAIVRQMQIAEKYETLSPEKREEFDKRAREYLSDSFSDTIVVHVISGYHLGMYSFYDKPSSFPCPYWQIRTTDMLKNTVFLIPSRGDRIPLQQFIVSQGAVCEFDFVFPRQYKGSCVLSEQDKFLSLEFTGPKPATPVLSVMQDQDIERMLIEFEVSKMQFNGDVVF